MAKYSASEASARESSSGGGFRIAKDGEKAKVIFLYAGPESIDGWACHRFGKPNGYTYILDCPRGPKDPLEDCPACKAGEQIYTRLFVRMLNVTTGEVTVWDRASSFRKDLLGFMDYFNPLYSVVYEITRHGSGLDTKYQFQSLPGESGMTEEQYKKYVEEADKKATDMMRPIDQYLAIKKECEEAEKQAKAESVNVQGANPQGAWGTPPQGAWGAPGQAPWQGNNQVPPAQQGGWGQAPMQQTPPQAQPNQNTPPQQGNWGAPADQQPPQNWGQPPQAWGQNG